ncbi:MAG: HAD family hydrolase [Terracidiphilus sp.]
MNTHLPQNILFDLDGTLLDSLPGIEFSAQAAFDACCLPLPNSDFRALIGPPIRTILSRAGSVVDASTLDALELAFRASYDSEGWRRTVCFPDAKQVLRIMREQGHRLFVVSNKPRTISLKILESNSIPALFELIVTRDSSVPAYPGKAAMIEAVIKSYKLASEDCLLVGDTMEDAEAAYATGIAFAYMKHGYGDVPEGAAIPVAFRFDGFSQFLPRLAEECVHD